ncbi:MAG: MFS transporter [Ilumatobacteraceae bacterium]|nr:MFS transporter [Ilumatobacteraceae bacterium]
MQSSQKREPSVADPQPSAMTSAERDTATLSVLMFASGATAVSNSIIFGALGDLQDTYGFADFGLGLIAGIGFLMGLLTQVFIAPLADTYKPKVLMVTGLGFAAVGSLVFALGDTLWQFVIGRAIVGVSFGCTQPAARAIAANLDKSRAAERLGKLAGVETAGIVGGPFISGMMLDPLGLRATFLVFALVAVAASLTLAAKSLPKLPSSGESRRISLTLLRYPGVRTVALTTMSLYLPIGVYDALWDRYLTDRGASNFVVGLSFLLYGIPFVLLARLGGRLADKWGALRTALYAIFILAPVVAGYGLAATPLAIIIVSIVEGVVQAATIPASQASMSQVAPEGRAAAAQGLSGASNLVGAAATAFVSPWIYGAHGPVWAFGIIAAVMLSISLVAQTMARRHDLL